MKNIKKMAKIIYHATGNYKKYEMVRDFFEKYLPEVTLKQLDIDFFEEQILDSEKISISKAKQAWEVVKQPVLVDDLGVYFEKYNKFPGALTKQFVKGLGLEGLYRLFDQGDRATMYLTITYITSENNFVCITTETPGKLIKPAGLIPIENITMQQIIVPDGCTKTMHELIGTPDYEKIHPRNIALKKFLEIYSKEIYSKN